MTGFIALALFVAFLLGLIAWVVESAYRFPPDRGDTGADM